jgi:hypothetical protein
MEGGFFDAAASGFFAADCGPAICALATETNANVSIKVCHSDRIFKLRTLSPVFW